MWFPHCFHMKSNLFLTILSMLSYFGFLKKKAGLLFFVSKTLVEWSSDRFSHLTPFLDSTRFLIKKDHIYSIHIFTYAPSWSQQDVKNVYFTVLFMKPTGRCPWYLDEHNPTYVLHMMRFIYHLKIPWTIRKDRSSRSVEMIKCWMVLNR